MYIVQGPMKTNEEQWRWRIWEIYNQMDGPFESIYFMALQFTRSEIEPKLSEKSQKEANADNEWQRGHAFFSQTNDYILTKIEKGPGIIADLQFREIDWVLKAIWHNLPSNGKIEREIDTQAIMRKKRGRERERIKDRVLSRVNFLLQSIWICIMFNG